MEVTLVDVFGTEASIVQAARVSYGDGTKTTREDVGLIRYLMRNWHTTPFEMVTFKFRIKAPIFVARQIMRHRTASVNELSARYSIVKDEYWVPETFRTQSKVNKQGSGTPFENDELKAAYIESCDRAFATYKSLIDGGVSRELARGVLPQCTFTEFVFQINLHNCLHLLELRMDSHAQPETQEIATLMWEHVLAHAPNVAKAFMDYRVTALSLSGPEMRGEELSPGETREFKQKIETVRDMLSKLPTDACS